MRHVQQARLAVEAAGWAGTLHADPGARARTRSGEEPQQLPPGRLHVLLAAVRPAFSGPITTVLHRFYESVSPSL